jgi:transcriptional regulator with XRE-family HTH domain
LAARLNVTVNNIGHWEQGRTEPNIDTLLELANIFDISINDLLC